MQKKIKQRLMNKVYSVLLCCLFVCLGCSDKSARYHLPTAPDYTQENAWYKELNAKGERQADVFYIAPTCVWD